MSFPKIAGLLLLFLGPACAGFFRAKAIRRALGVEEALADLIRFIQNSIETLRSPLSEIFSSYQNETLEDCGFLPRLRSDGWEKAAESAKGVCSDKTVDLLLSFGKGLGKSDVSHQSDLCRWHLRLLEEELKKEREKAQKDAKMAILLGITAGLLLVILLI